MWHENVVPSPTDIRLSSYITVASCFRVCKVIKDLDSITTLLAIIKLLNFSNGDGTCILTIWSAHLLWYTNVLKGEASYKIVSYVIVKLVYRLVLSYAFNLRLQVIRFWNILK